MSRLKTFAVIIGCASILSGLLPTGVTHAENPTANTSAPIRVGWIGAMTGALSKYGAYQSALLAEEEINASGGIGGHPIKLIYEDGKGDPKTALSAAMKLINSDGVKVVLGGHCTPESLAIAPLLERQKVVMLAAITSNPKLTTAGDYIFRLTPVSLKVADMLAPFLLEERKYKRIAIVHEETDYARPVAEHLRDLIQKNGGEVVEFQNYNPGETDFRAILTRLRSKNPDAVFLGVQAQDAAVLFMQQLHDLGIKVPVFGNEITGNSVSAAKGREALFDGLIYPEPNFDLDRTETKEFIERYKAKFKVEGLPMGFWSAEAYDSVRLLAKIIGDCGSEPENVKRCLYAVKDYPGVSANVSIDRNGDGVREYFLKVIHGGKSGLLKRE